MLGMIGFKQAHRVPVLSQRDIDLEVSVRAARHEAMARRREFIDTLFADIRSVEESGKNEPNP